MRKRRRGHSTRGPGGPGGPASRRGRMAGVLVALLVVGGGCSINADNPAGFEYAGRGPSVVEVDSFTVTGEDTTWAAEFRWDDVELIAAGSFHGYHALSLIRFTGLPEGAAVQGARLILRRRTTTASTDSTRLLTLSVRPVSTDWDSTWWGDDASRLTVGSSLSQVGVPIVSETDTVGFTLPSSLVQGWVDDEAAARRGLALTAPDDGPFIQFFDSNDAVGGRAGFKPELRLTYVPAGGAENETLSLDASRDLTLFTTDGVPPADELWASRGASWRSVLTFDISAIPASATVNRAELTVQVDTGASVGLPMGIFSGLTDDLMPWALPTSEMLAPGTGTIAYTVSEGDSTVTMGVTRAVETHTRLGRDTLQLLVAASGEATGAGRVVLPNTSAAPVREHQLRVFYSVPPGGGR
ncbi:MAG: hypothetical protein R6W82_04885 [bacterium]